MLLPWPEMGAWNAVWTTTFPDRIASLPRRAEVTQHRENPVLLNQFLRRQHRLFWVVPRILNAKHHAVADMLAIVGGRPGQVRDAADDNLLVAHARGVLGKRHGGFQAQSG